MKTKKGQTIGEVSEILQVSTVTTRNYVNLLGTRFLSPDATRKTGKKFTPGDISTLKAFRSLLGEGFTWENALSQLPTPPEIVENTPEETEEQAEETTTTAIQTLEVLERFQALLKMQAEQFTETVKAKDEHIETLKAENKRLQEENAFLKTPWYRKLFKGR